jgi:thioredoxin reductase (NADPH)
MTRPSGVATLADAGERPATVDTDALVIGAGPVGLFQVFQLGLQEIRAHVVDSLPRAGGQCMALYPDKPIYDIPALPLCTGRELTERLLAQSSPFEPGFHFGQEVSELHPQAGGPFVVKTSAGLAFRCKTVIVAAGVGAFQPRRLKVDALARFEGTQLHYHAAVQVAALAGLDVVVIGGEELALRAAIDLASAEQARSVTLLHRRAELQGAAPILDRFHAECQAGRLQFTVGQVVGAGDSSGVLEQLRIEQPDGTVLDLAADRVLVYQGLSPRLGPLAQWGLGLDRKQVVVDTERFETQIRGIFAVGDINTYPGKLRLIVSGFHEATLAAVAAGARLHPGRPSTLEYTTSSARLQRLLGVTGVVAEKGG